jgi:hypothetical protein
MLIPPYRQAKRVRRDVRIRQLGCAVTVVPDAEKPKPADSKALRS